MARSLCLLVAFSAVLLGACSPDLLATTPAATTALPGAKSATTSVAPGATSVPAAMPAPSLEPATPTEPGDSRTPVTTQESAPATAANPPTPLATVTPALVIPASLAAVRTYSATVRVDGSSTVFPITEIAAQELVAYASQIQVQLGVSGTGGGFKKFCTGETEVSNASRPINQEEIDACTRNGIAFVELPLAYDGLSVIVNPANTWAECLTVAELKRIWEPAAEGSLSLWNQIRPEFPAEPITLYGPGRDSGTYDYFTGAIVGEEGVSRSDFTGSEDDYLLAQDVAADPHGLGFFGVAYYREYQEYLRVVAIDGGNGCIAPTEEHIADGSYQPLSRPLFIYVRADALEQPAVQAFVEFYVANARQFVTRARYVPLTRRLYGLVAQRTAARTVGTVFDSGMQVGLSLQDLLELERQ